MRVSNWCNFHNFGWTIPLSIWKKRLTWFLRQSRSLVTSNQEAYGSQEQSFYGGFGGDRDICGWISQICVRETSWMLLLPSWGSSVMRWIVDYPFLSTNVEMCLWLLIYTKRVAEQRVSKERTGPLQTIAFFFAVSWDSVLLALPLHISVDLLLNNNLFVCVSHSNAYGAQKFMMMCF